MKKEKRKVAAFSVMAAIFLTAFKLIVGLVTGSLGLLSEALHSGLDLAAAVITWLTVRISDRPPDHNHQYGHGKFENFSALVETILLLVTCIWIIYESIDRLVTGNTKIEVTIFSYIVVITSILVDLGRSRALYRVARKYNSQALEADALHFSTDIWSSAVVLLGLILSQFEFYFADSLAALGVALIVLSVSWKLGKRAVDVLLDRCPAELERKIESILDHAPVVKYHDLKVRSSGAGYFIEVTIHVQPEMSLEQAHTFSHQIEKQILDAIPHSSVHIHFEPDTHTP